MSDAGCCNQPPAVTFVYSQWVSMFPALANINQNDAQSYFSIAQIFVANNLRVVRCASTLLTLLNMVTAHIAFLFAMRDPNGNPSSTGTVAPPTLVGRLSDATEGSVSVSTEYATEIPMSAAYWLQSPYGAMFWQASAVYRMAIYKPGVRRRPLAGRPWLFPNGS